MKIKEAYGRGGRIRKTDRPTYTEREREREGGRERERDREREWVYKNYL